MFVADSYIVINDVVNGAAQIASFVSPLGAATKTVQLRLARSNLNSAMLPFRPIASALSIAPHALHC